MSTDAGTIRTAFDGVQRTLGAEFMEWEGWEWTTEFGDAVAEHNAVRQDVGVWDESPLRKWDFSGPDALVAADRIFTNDMLGLEIGQVRYAPFCDADGKMVGDGTVFKFTDSSAWVITALDSDLEHMRERRRRAERLHRADHGEAPARPAPGAALARAARRARRRGRREPPLLPLPPAPGARRPRPRLGLAHRLLRRARLRAVHGARLRRGALGRAHRGRRQAVRPLRGRVAPHRVGADLHRLRLLPARDRSVRHVARQGDPPRHGRLQRQGGARRDGEGAAAAARHARGRGLRRARVRRRGHEGRRAGRARSRARRRARRSAVSSAWPSSTRASPRRARRSRSPSATAAWPLRSTTSPSTTRRRRGRAARR